MFIRFRQVGRRLKVSIIKTRRVDGKVRHEHIASLGSIAARPDVPDRVAFWQKLHERLGRLSNRVDAETEGKLLGQVHARVPMPTIEEIGALQLENAEADERLWSGLQGLHEDSAAGQQQLRDTAEKAIAENQAAAEQAGKAAVAARERVERIKKGEPLAGGLQRPASVDEQSKAAGFTDSHLRHIKNVGELMRLLFGDDEAAIREWEHETARANVERLDRSHRAFVRRTLKRVKRRLEILTRVEQLSGPMCW